MAISADEDILRFEVTIYHTSCMETFDAFDNLGSIESSTVSTKTTPTSKLGGKITTRVEILMANTGDVSETAPSTNGIDQRTMTKKRFSLS